MLFFRYNYLHAVEICKFFVLIIILHVFIWHLKVIKCLNNLVKCPFPLLDSRAYDCIWQCYKPVYPLIKFSQIGAITHYSIKSYVSSPDKLKYLIDASVVYAAVIIKHVRE